MQNPLHQTLHTHKYGLFLTRRFWPIFWSQSLGALNDNLLRSGLVVMIAYAKVRGISLPLDREDILVTLCSGLLVLPLLLFSFLAGQLADKYEKARLITYTKFAEVGIMLGVWWGFETQNIYLLMALLFVSGTHSTFANPIKYSILPEHLREDELLAGNGFVSGGGYISILFGLITGGLLVVMPGNPIGWAALAIAAAGLTASLMIPRGKPAEPGMKLNFHLIHGTLSIIAQARKSNTLFHSILGLSWFLLIGSVFMAQFPNYAQGIMRADNAVYTLFLTVFSIGIAAGSVLCDKLLKGEVSPRYTPWALVGISVFTYMMVFTTPHPVQEGLTTIHDFVSEIRHLPVLVSMLMVAVCGGVYMVPLYALLQSRSESGARSRVMAASNLSDSIFMTAAAVVSALLLLSGLTVKDVFLCLATVNLLPAFLAYKAAKNHV